MNKKLLTAVVAATLAAAAGTANAIDLKISGGVHRALMWEDDGGNSQLFHVDPATWNSRIRFQASDDLVPGVKVGVNWESGYVSNNAGAVSQTVRFTNPTGLSERWQEIWFTGAFGKLSVGQGNSASKDGHASDLSGTDLFNGGNPTDIGGGLFFRTDTGTMALSGVTIANVLNTFEGARFDRVRYDTPAIGPVTLSAATGNNNNTDWADFAVRVNSDLGAAGKIAAAVYYANIKVADAATGITDGTGTQENVGFSASWLSPMGLNVTVAHATKEDEHATLPFDAAFTRVKVGYLMGEHAFSVGYALGEDQIRGLAGVEGEQISLAYNWKPKPWADLYAGVSVNSLEHPTITADDILIVAVGSRITF
jgi:predicted porin